MEYVTILEAAKRCGVSDKTIQRAIRRGLLPARYPQPNRCEIAVCDLEYILPGHMSGQAVEPLKQRVDELEHRVQQLECLVNDLLSRQEASSKQHTSKTRERTTGPLPKQLNSLLAFARLHNISEQKVLTHANMDIPLLKAVRGEWTDTDGMVVTLALNAKGRAAFHQLYRELPTFVPCKLCPH